MYPLRIRLLFKIGLTYKNGQTEKLKSNKNIWSWHNYSHFLIDLYVNHIHFDSISVPPFVSIAESLVIALNENAEVSSYDVD